MIEKIKKFMIGRYGFDQFSTGLTALFTFLFFIYLITQNTFFLYTSLLIVLYNYYRILSKNFSKRYNENRIFTNLMSPIYNFVEKIKIKIIKNKNKEYKYFHCKKCGQELRIPRKKGKVIITCPICKHQFEGRS